MKLSNLHIKVPGIMSCLPGRSSAFRAPTDPMHEGARLMIDHRSTLCSQQLCYRSLFSSPGIEEVRVRLHMLFIIRASCIINVRWDLQILISGWLGWSLGK